MRLIEDREILQKATLIDKPEVRRVQKIKDEEGRIFVVRFWYWGDKLYKIQ